MNSSTRSVCFPAGPDGARSTTAVARGVVADALLIQRPDWAEQVLADRNWRTGYVTHFNRLLIAALVSDAAWNQVATAGLSSAQARFVTADVSGEERPVCDLLNVSPIRKLRTVTVTGTSEPSPLVVPYRGKRLAGVALSEQLERWTEAGVIEHSACTAVHAVLDNPQWLSLPGHVVAVLGAGSEMGPTSSLLSWGATVAAVDRPDERLWSRVIGQARSSAGSLLVPVNDDAELEDDDFAYLAGQVGLDLLSDVPELSTWLADVPGTPVVGNYTYADGGVHVQLSVAADLLARRLRLSRPDTSLAYLATPTDTFAVPAGAVEAARAAYAGRRGLSRLGGNALRALSGGRLLAPNYEGDGPFINDALVAVQGPNYAFAKRLQRWSATVARNAGATVSLNVAPATRTRSVVKKKALAAAYAGAHRFGVEIFEPQTTNALMAALLVHDLSVPAADSGSSWQDEANGAVHGGLWRSAYEPRSGLTVSAAFGAPALLPRLRPRSA
jgi:hypothetical protein